MANLKRVVIRSQGEGVQKVRQVRQVRKVKRRKDLLLKIISKRKSYRMRILRIYIIFH